jgi:hypothetical protein
MNESPVIQEADSDEDQIKDVRNTIEPKIIIIPKDEELK